MLGGGGGGQFGKVLLCACCARQYLADTAWLQLHAKLAADLVAQIHQAPPHHLPYAPQV